MAKRFNISTVLKKLIFLLLPLPVLFFLNNCYEFSGFSNQGSLQLSLNGGGGSDGEGFEGKPKDYSRLVSGYTCNNTIAEYARLSRNSADQFVLTTNKDNMCGLVSSVDSNELFTSPNTDQVMAYKEGVYAPLEKARVYQNPADPPKYIFTEAWCHSYKEGGQGVDYVFKWDEATGASFVRIYSTTEAGPAEEDVYVEKEMTFGKLVYLNRSAKYRFDVLLDQPSAESEYEVMGYIGRVTEELPTEKLYCRLGGQFDPVVEKVAYPTENIFSVNKPIRPLYPELSASVIEYGIEPALPRGLTLDRHSGAISGTPVQTARYQKYIVAAKFKFGTIRFVIGLGVANEYNVNTTSLAHDLNPGDGVCKSLVGLCDLQSAIDEANATAIGAPSIIMLPSGRHLLLGEELKIVNDTIVIGGSATIIDADAKSRIFNVQPNAKLWLRSLTLTHGLARLSGGGAIYANAAGGVSIDGVSFESNFTRNMFSTAEYDNNNPTQGGAIYTYRTDLKVVNSTFTKNETDMGGADLYGGGLFHKYARLEIVNTVFDNNRSIEGGALYVEGATPGRIRDSIFKSNYAFQGAGVFIRGGDTIVERSQFEFNTSAFDGGGLYAFWYGSVVIADSIFSKNDALYGSAINISEGAYPKTYFLIDGSQFLDNLDSALSYYSNSNVKGQSVRLESYATWSIDLNVRNSVFRDGDRMQNCFDLLYGLGADSSRLFQFKDLGGNVGDDDSCQFNANP